MAFFLFYFFISVTAMIKEALCYEKKYGCMQDFFFFLIITTSCSFSVCLRIGPGYAVCVFVYIIASGISQAQGYAGVEVPVGCNLFVLITPGVRVCVSGCVPGCLRVSGKKCVPNDKAL